MTYSLFLYKYQVQNTLPTQRRGSSMTQVPPLALIGSVRAATRQQEYSRLWSRSKTKEKERSAFSAATL